MTVPARRVALGIAYDGTAWRGWQTQTGGQTVQDSLEVALQAFAGQKLPTICAGRTDTGVHALGQVVHVDAPFERDPIAWVRGVNSHLPESVSVQWASPVSEAFHARFSATSRSYTYVILNTPVRHPLWAGKAGWCFRPLDADRMHESAQLLLGEHDFSSFRSSQCQAASPIRTMTQATVEREGTFVILRFSANAFLHHMIRNLVGELVYLGQGKTTLEHFKAVIKAKDRTVAAPTYAAGGLYLTGVDYPPELLEVPEQPDILPLLSVGSQPSVLQAQQSTDLTHKPN